MRHTVQNLGITLALLLGFIGTTLAQGTQAGTTAPKALNPQPEVPSKPKASESVAAPKGGTEPKALDPQPEVPSKPKPKTKKKPPKAAEQ